MSFNTRRLHRNRVACSNPQWEGTSAGGKRPDEIIAVRSSVRPPGGLFCAQLATIVTLGTRASDEGLAANWTGWLDGRTRRDAERGVIADAASRLGHDSLEEMAEVHLSPLCERTQSGNL